MFNQLVTLARLTWTEANHRLASAGGNANVSSFLHKQRQMNSDDPSCNLERNCLLPLYWESHFIFLLVSLGGIYCVVAWWTMYFDMLFLILSLNALLARSTFSLVLVALVVTTWTPHPSSVRWDGLGLVSHVDAYQILCFWTLSHSASLHPFIWREGGASLSCRTSSDVQPFVFVPSSYQL